MGINKLKFIFHIAKKIAQNSLKEFLPLCKKCFGFEVNI